MASSGKDPALRIRTYLCTYCGEPGNSLDHVVPLKFALRRPRNGNEHTGVPTVEACPDCNGTLSSVVLPSIAARKAHVHARLQVKLKPALRFGIALAEIEKLGKTLRTTLLRKLAAKERAVRRLGFSGRPYTGEEPDLSGWL